VPIGGGGGGDPVPTNAVSVEDSFFSPALISVVRGDVVVWTWNGSREHDVTWVSGNLANSPTQSGGSHEVMMPSTPGQLGYYCTIHGTPSSGMQGTIIVQ
jgi:plastocyanin